MGEAPVGYSLTDPLPARCANGRVNLRWIPIEEVPQPEAIPDFDPPGLGTLDRRRREKAVRHEQAPSAVVPLHAVDELPHSAQIDGVRPALYLDCDSLTFEDGDDVSSLVESADRFDLFESENPQEIRDDNLEFESVHDVDLLETRIRSKHLVLTFRRIAPNP